MKARQNLLNVSDMSVIITGATRGIGVGIASLLSKTGSSLTLGYHEQDEPAFALKEKLKSSDTDVILHKCDLTTPEGAKGIVSAALDHFGRVDALVSNLGPFLWKDIAGMSIDEWDRMVQANLSSHFYLVKELLPGMRGRGQGKFIFIGGVGSGLITGHPKASAYNAAKTGLADFMRSLAVEEAGNGIRSNMITPGIIDNGEYTDGFRERIVGDIPLGYIGQPEDIANAVLWLLSPEAGYITGAIIDVSGGYHLATR